MKTIATLTIAAGILSLAACSQPAEDPVVNDTATMTETDDMNVMDAEMATEPGMTDMGDNMMMEGDNAMADDDLGNPDDLAQ